MRLLTTLYRWVLRLVISLFTSVPKDDPLPQRESLYKLGNQLAMESLVDGFESFQYKDQTQVTSYKKSGEKICVTLENVNTGKFSTCERYRTRKQF